MASIDQNYQAKVEDYHSDESDGQVMRENFPRNKSPSAQANVSTKRSKDLNTEKAPMQEKMMPANIDLRSDSGYSSYTGVSKSSADSAQSTSRNPPPLPTASVPAAARSPAPKSRRPTGGDAKQHSNESSPRQKPLRTASVSSKQRPAAGQRRTTLTQDPREDRREECNEPDWLTCGPKAELPHRRRPEVPPFASGRDVRDIPGFPSDQMSQRSDPNPYYSPSSPTYTRQPAPYPQGPAVVQTARTRRPSSASRPRPQTFAAGESGGSFWPGMSTGYPSPPQERGPPPSFSAYQNMHNMPNMHNMQYPSPVPGYGMPMPQAGYYPPQHQTSPPYENPSQRPPMSARGSGSYGPRSYPAPIITQEGSGEPSKYSARYGQPPTPVEHPPQRQMRITPKQQPKLLQYGREEEDDEGSEDESSEGEYDDVEYERDMRSRAAHAAHAAQAKALMPPPQIKRSQSQRRPPLAHAKTAPAVERAERRRDREQRRQSIVVPDPPAPRERRQEREREREHHSRTNTAPLRRASVSRPPLDRQTRSEYDTPRARVVVNNSRSDRQQSYQTYERERDEAARAAKAMAKALALEEQYRAEKKREKRASRIIVQQHHVPGGFDTDTEEEEEEPPVAVRPRRKTDAAEGRKTKERIVEAKSKRKVDAAEEYIMSTRGARDPYADQITKAATKRSSRKLSMPSESGSSQSNGSGRASQSNRTTMTSNTNNEVRLRIDGGQSINLQLSGDMEGRTLQLMPAENGMTDLVIGNARGGETAYRSEKGSISGNNNRRSLIGGQGRRDVEDISERTSRGGRSRRDPDEMQERDDRDRRDHILRRARNSTSYRS